MKKTNANKSRFALTVGDPSGIGPEIVAKALSILSPKMIENLVVVGPAQIVHKTAHDLGISLPKFSELQIEETGPFKLGAVTAQSGRAAIQAIEAAHSLCSSGECDGMITGPIGKKAIRLAGSPFSGHTDMLESLSGSTKTKMAMVYRKFRVVMTTLHVPYAKVTELLSEDEVFYTIRLGHEMVLTNKKTFPNIAVAGLNPHAGEQGLFGPEEEKYIIPAIKKFSQINPNVCGPFPADSMFKPEMRQKYDLFVAHTHDQGLIAIKTLFGEKCVNVTLGLPYIRTSVGHGTAYDIAGTGRADPTGMIEAIRVAFNLAKNKKEQKSLYT